MYNHGMPVILLCISVASCLICCLSKNCLDFSNDCGGQPNTDIDNSFAFYSCQNQLASSNGGCVNINKGTYQILNVQLNTSNIIYYIDSSVTFIPYHGITKSNTPVFFVGSQQDYVENISVIGLSSNNSRFLVDLRNNTLSPWNVRGFQMFGIKNFVLSNIEFKIHANLSDEKAAIAFDHTFYPNGSIIHPKNGQVLNIKSSDYTYGYGTIQVTSGENIYFDNIDGTGGATLRLEPIGNFDGYINNITAKNVICRNGKSALSSQPHTQKNGVYKLYNFQSYSCYVGVEINGGYSQNGKPPGYFSNDSIIDGVTSYWGTNAQIYGDDSQVIIGPSCAPCGIQNELNYKVTVSNLQSNDFPAPSNRNQCLYWTKHPLPTVCPWDNSSLLIAHDK